MALRERVVDLFLHDLYSFNPEGVHLIGVDEGQGPIERDAGRSKFISHLSELDDIIHVFEELIKK